MTTQETYTSGERVRLTVPGVHPDHDGLVVRLGVTMVFRVLSQVDAVVKVVQDVTGRRYVLPANKLTRVG